MTEVDLHAICRTLGLILLVLLTISLCFAKDLILPLLMGTLLTLTRSPLVRACSVGVLRRGSRPRR